VLLEIYEGRREFVMEDAIKAAFNKNRIGTTDER
jgi:hypothetical protein